MSDNIQNRYSTDEYRSLIATSMEGFLLVDRDGYIRDVNDSHCSLLGYRREELLGSHLSQIDSEQDEAEVARRLALIMSEGSQRFETRHKRRDGALINVEVSASYIGADGGLICSFIRDVSSEKRTIAVITARIRLMEFSFSHSLNELLTKTLDEAEELTGSCIGFYHFMDDDSQMLTLQAWSTRTSTAFCKAEGAGSHYAVASAGVWVDCVKQRRPIIHNDYASLPHRKGMPEGHAVVVRELVVPVMRLGKVVAILGVGNKETDYDERDVETIWLLAGLAWELAERKRIEEELTKSEAILDASQLVANVGGWEWDCRSRTMTWTDQVYRIHGMEPGVLTAGSPEHIDKSLSCYRQEDRGAIMDAFNRCAADGEPYDLEFPFRTVTGRDGWIRTVARAIREGSAVSRVIGTIQDISVQKKVEEERKRLDEQLREAQKLESLGILAGGIAHDFNNILQVIMGNAEMVRMRLPADSQADKYLADISRASSRAAELCRQMLAYAGKAPFARGRLDMAALVEEMVRMLRSTLSQNVVLAFAVPEDLPAVIADSSQIRQIVINLVINGAEAVGEGQGLVRVSLYRNEAAPGGQEKDYLGRDIEPGWYVCMKVTDSGCGMSDEVRQHIFDPFFTTKFTGRGLGMPAVLGIISSHHGALQLDTAPDRGTAFTVWLPAEPMDAEGAFHEQSDGCPGKGTILLVEDEELVRALCREMLSELGYEVAEAADGCEALELFRQRRQEIVMVVTDIGMPLMDGYALSRELKSIAPELPIVISSGFGDTVIAERLPAGMISGVVNKPFRLAQLREVLMSAAVRADDGV